MATRLRQGRLRQGASPESAPDIQTPPAPGPEPAAISVEGPELSDAGLGVVLVGALLAILDFFIVNVAVPTIGRGLHASGATLELVVAGYGIAYATLLVVGGRLGDTVGRRRLFLIGMSLFTLTSLACGLAPSPAVLVAARVAQGASAAMMVPQVLATIQATTTGGRRARALGLFGATAGIAAAAGQLLGGILVSANLAGTTWRPIFLVNVPVGIVGVLLARRVVPNTRSSNPAVVDTPGTVLLGAALLAFLIPITEGRSLGWPPWVWVLLALSPILGGGFLLVERRGEQSGRVPLVPPSLVRHRSMRRGLLLAMPFFAGFGGFMFVYTVALQTGLHLSPFETGLALAPLAVAFLVASLCTARLLARFGRSVITVGAGLQGLGLVGLVLTAMIAWPHLTPAVLAPAMTITGAGQGFVMTPLFGVILSEVPPERAGVGSGIMATGQQASLALGVGTLGTLFLSLGHPGQLGLRGAFVAVVLIDIAVAAFVVVLSRRLPGR
jgi:EmrB/QacA subfamily drug resistance transporter